MGQPRVVIVGGGFAGYHAAKTLQRLSPRVETVLLNATDYFLYLPLLPEVAGGLLEPRRVCVSLRRWPGRVRLHVASASGIDTRQHRVEWINADGQRGQLEYDRLLLTVGSVNRLLPIPGVAANAHGFRNVSEALYLRDHIVRQLELAATSNDAAERTARTTFVVVGAGYTGTELAAQGHLMSIRVMRTLPQLAGLQPRWLLVDAARSILSELDPRLGRTATRVLLHRGVEVRTGQSITSADPGSVMLTTGERVATQSLIWCVGVRPDPLVADLGLPADHGRLVVDERLSVPDTDGSIFACGDCAAVPDLTRPGELTGMTAQHAQRQGRRAALNIAASLGIGEAEPYRHRDLGFLVDLGGLGAAANPLGVPLSGPAAKAVTRGYHLLSLPGNRLRTAADWSLNAVSHPPSVMLGLVQASDVPLDTEAAHTDGRPGANGSQRTEARGG